MLSSVREKLIKICSDAQGGIIEWAAKRVKENSKVSRIVIVGGLGKNWYFQEEFKKKVNEEKIYNVPTAHM